MSVSVRNCGLETYCFYMCLGGETWRRDLSGRVASLKEEVARCTKEFEQHYVQARYPDARLTPYEDWEAGSCL